jgi:hypothetical protein
MISRDESFAEGCRLGWRHFWIGLITLVLGLGAICVLCSLWEQIEIANAVQRAMQ